MRIQETKLVEVHSHASGASPFTFAQNWVKRWLAEDPESAPNAEVIGSHFSGERCIHGSSVVAVVFEYDADE